MADGSMPHTIVYLALGSNLGDRRVNLSRALDALQLDPAITVTAVSPIYETAPVGGPEKQPKYFNTADCYLVLIETPIDLGRLLKINKPAMRVRYELDQASTRTLKEGIEKALSAW